MLTHMKQVEEFFGYQGAAQPIEHLARYFPVAAIKDAIKAGDLHAHVIDSCCGECGRVMVWLSDQGKEKARERCTALN